MTKIAVVIAVNFQPNKEWLFQNWLSTRTIELVKKSASSVTNSLACKSVVMKFSDKYDLPAQVGSKQACSQPAFLAASPNLRLEH